MQIITQVWDYYTDASSNFVPEERLNDLVIGAWDEFGKGWGKAMAQRLHILWDDEDQYD